MTCIESNWSIGENAPIRALKVGVTKLIPAEEEAEQVSLFDLMGGDQQKKKREKQDKLEAAVYALRQKKGSDTITLGFHKNEDIGIHKKS